MEETIKTNLNKTSCCCRDIDHEIFQCLEFTLHGFVWSCLLERRADKAFSNTVYQSSQETSAVHTYTNGSLQNAKD